MSDQNMPKQRKISIQFFLHKKLEPTLIHIGDRKRKGYPLYVYVTYNRKNMQFKSSHSMWYADMEDVERKSPGLMDREIKLINQIIRFEESQLQEKDEYEMKGFKERYDFYSVSIRDVLEKYLKAKLQFEIKRTNSPMFNVLNFSASAGLIGVLTLYEAAQKLYDNLFAKMDSTIRQYLDLYVKTEGLFKSKGKHEFPSLIDWFDGSFSSRMILEKQLNKSELSVLSLLIDVAIKHYQKLLDKEN